MDDISSAPRTKLFGPEQLNIISVSLRETLGNDPSVPQLSEDDYARLTLKLSERIEAHAAASAASALVRGAKALLNSFLAI